MKMKDKLRIAVEELDKNASWDEGAEVTPGFDNPELAKTSREALRKIRGGDGRPRPQVRTLGRINYDAYKDIMGLPLASWDQLNDEARSAWEAGAAAVLGSKVALHGL